MASLRRFRTAILALAAFLAGPAVPAAEPDPPPADRLRDELRGFFEHGSDLSPTALAGLSDAPGLEQAILDGLSSLAPEDLASLSPGFDGVPAWEVAPEALAAALPPNVREMLARHGEQAAQAARESETFRDELSTFLAAAHLLPAPTRARIGLGEGSLERGARSLAELDLGALGQARASVDGLGDWRGLRAKLLAALPPAAARHLPALAERLPFDDAERDALDAFRDDVARSVDRLDALPPGLAARAGAAVSSRLRVQLASALPAQLFVLREEIDAAALARAVDTLAVLAGQPPSEGLARELESFRAEMLQFYRDLDESSAAATVESLSPRRLALLRGAILSRPERSAIPLDLAEAIGGLPDAAIEVALVNLNCVASLGSINVLGTTISLGTLDLNWLCTPLENAINAVDSAVNSLSNTVDGVVAAVTDLPDLLLSALEGFFQSLLADVNAFFSPANLQNLLGLAGDFWNDLPQLPQIPCPPQGTEIPFFGPVGDPLTAAKYGRYLWVFDKVLEMIPDTEMSLSVKIPAQILYAGVQYIEVCLDAAVAENDAVATDAFRAEVSAGLTAAGGGIAGIGARLDSFDAGLADLRGLELDLAIEAALAEGGGGTRSTRLGTATSDPRIVSFQLPFAFGGALEWVRDTVATAIARMQLAGQDVHCAPIALDSGDEAFAIGEYKTAFERYRRAYQEAARGGSPGCAVADGTTSD